MDQMTKQLGTHGSNVMCNTASESWTKCQAQHSWGQVDKMSVIKQVEICARGPNVSNKTVRNWWTKCQI
jgi:hypothetical protein